MKDNEILDSAATEKLARIAIILVLIEFKKACEKFPSFNSGHEGYAVLKEEVDELWDEIKLKDELKDNRKLLSEATQIAAMAVRFMVDVCLSKKQHHHEHIDENITNS